MNVWQFIHEKYSLGIPVVLLYVLESKGSSPGRQGFNMAVAGDADFCGTIGGGIMEHKFVEMAKSQLQAASVPQRIIKQVHDKSAGINQSGMICSGEQTIWIYHVQATDFNHVSSLIKSLGLNKNGTLQLSENGISFSDMLPTHDYYFEQQDEQHFLLIEKTGLKNIIHIIGGGHCALALSQLMSRLDFYINLYEERGGLNTMAQNVYAHNKQVINSYTELERLILPGNNVYVVIMTFGYRTDDLAVRALMGKEFKYIGLLGSEKKIVKMKEEYAKENLNPEFLKIIHAPVGIQIRSQTTAEIAISIAAEIIAIKNSPQ